MVVIKRYPNRKLYDTEAKRYITLEGIAELIRQGEQVSVVDHATGEDLTAVTMSQIIFEQERKQGGFLPQSVLTELVQAGGDTLDSLQRTLSTSVSVLRQVDEEIERRVQALVRQGELAEEEGLRLLGQLLGQDSEVYGPSWPTNQHLERVISRKVPTRAEIKKLDEQLEALAAQLNLFKAKD